MVVGPVCAISVCTAISGEGSFKDLDYNRTPGGLADDLINIQGGQSGGDAFMNSSSSVESSNKLE